MVSKQEFSTHLDSVHVAITAAVRQRDAEGFVALYTPNGSLMTPDGAVIAGSTALRDAFTRWTEGGWVDQHTELVELTIDERTVVEVGRSTCTFRTDAVESSVRNNYIVVHTLTHSDHWLMHYDIWNTMSDDVPCWSY